MHLADFVLAAANANASAAVVDVAAAGKTSFFFSTADEQQLADFVFAMANASTNVIDIFAAGK